MVIINHHLYLSVADLVDVYGMSEDYVKQSLTRYRNGEYRSWVNIQDPEKGSRRLVLYSSIPPSTISKYDIPSETALIAKHNSSRLETIVQDFAGIRFDQAENFFKANPHTHPHAREHAEQSIWLLFLAAMKPSQAKSLGSTTDKPVEELYARYIPYLQDKKWKGWKVNSLQVLRRKLKAFKALFKKPLNGSFTLEQWHQCLDGLVHKGIGNKNREKFGEEQRACVFVLYASNAKLNETQVHAMYLNKVSEKISLGEWDESAIVSLSTIKSFLYEPEVKQAYWKPRHGRQEYRKHFEMITHRKPASMANAMWVIDGTPWHRYYMQGDSAYARLNVFVVLDAHSWCVLGYYISESETSEAVISALRQACERTGYLPYQIQFDNSAAIKSYHAQACINAIAKYATPTQVGNARSKTIEAFFKHFNNQVLRFRPGYTHSPVMSNNVNGKPNPEALQQQVKSAVIPTSREQAIKELEEDFYLWNFKAFNGKLAPVDKLKQSIANTEKEQRKLTQQILVEAFYTMPGTLKKVRGVDSEGKLRQLKHFFPEGYQYTNEGLEIQIEKTKYIFSTQDPNFNALHLGRKFAVKYDPIELQHEGLKQIYLYEITEEGPRPFLHNNTHASLRNPELFSQALFDRVKGEGHALHEHLQSKRAQESEADALANKYIRLAKSTGSFVEVKAENAYPKEVINGAKAALMEKIINGEQRQLTGSAEQVTVKNQISGASRWDD